MKKRAILTAIITALSVLKPSCIAAQSRLRTSIPLSGESARIRASEVIPNFTTSTSYGIGYLEYVPPHRSFADRAAEVQSTLSGLCHVDRIPGSRFEIAQSCPAERGKKDRIKAWRDFFNAQGEASIPKRSEVYVVHDGRWFLKTVAPLQEKSSCPTGERRKEKQGEARRPYPQFGALWDDSADV